MLKTSVITSGSKGNCILASSGNTNLLIDAGITFKKLNQALQTFEIPSEKINGILISHEHSDHVNGAGVLCRKTKAPLYITVQTYRRCKEKLGELPYPPVHFEVGDTIRINDLTVKTFTSSHDAIDSCNFVIFHQDYPDKQLAIATDLGYSPQILINNLREATTIILESNHDVKMLLEGPYDWHLKQRIKSNVGHLSNEQAVGVISQIISDKLEHLFLAHLSEINNSPDLAYNLMNNFLTSISATTKLIMTSQTEHTPLFNV